MDGEFRGRAMAVIGNHDHHVRQFLAVAAGHMDGEFLELGFADAPFALVDVVSDILVQTGKHAVYRVIVEGGEVALDEIAGSIFGHGGS